jgi:hypothetical protein
MCKAQTIKLADFWPFLTMGREEVAWQEAFGLAVKP